ncbi:MAG: hypothetical protein KDC39_06180 [Actinobacteria bacterium]|nr:hypothetical protein [Actinomycetota bacterium]
MSYVDGPAAQQEAVEELARPIYAEAQPNLLERLINWLGDLIDTLLNSASGGPGRGILIILAALVVVALIWAVLRWRRSGPGAARVFDAPEPLTATDYESAARQAWQRQAYDEVIVNVVRGLVRSRQQAGLIPQEPGLTVTEAMLPGDEPAVIALFSHFSDVRYGSRHVSAAAAEAAMGLLQVTS